jgi:hypothetical protein
MGEISDDGFQREQDDAANADHEDPCSPRMIRCGLPTREPVLPHAAENGQTSIRVADSDECD